MWPKKKKNVGTTTSVLYLYHDLRWGDVEVLRRQDSLVAPHILYHHWHLHNVIASQDRLVLRGGDGVIERQNWNRTGAEDGVSFGRWLRPAIKRFLHINLPVAECQLLCALPRSSSEGCCYSLSAERSDVPSGFWRWWTGLRPSRICWCSCPHIAPHLWLETPPKWMMALLDIKKDRPECLFPDSAEINWRWNS